MQEREVINTFHDGLNLDTPNYQTPNSVYTYAEDITFITHSGNELILQNEKGTEYKTSIKENFIPLAVKSYGQIAYIISAEVINDAFTGRGEIGTFPSPDYNNLNTSEITSEGVNYLTTLIEEYHPFSNYGGDNGIALNSKYSVKGRPYGEFNSINFNFQETNFVEITATQLSFDGTVNVFFTDGINRPKLINSRFTVLPNNQVKIINRTGTDSNLYVEDNFQNTLNHVLTSRKLLQVQFNGQRSGQLPTGNYQYFFRYLTRDGNTTNVRGQSFNIPVFFGDRVSNTKGGIRNEQTSKSNVLELSSVDSSYYAIKVYFTYSTGTEGADAQVEAFEITREFPILGTTLSIQHTGFEVTQPYAVEELTFNYESVETYRTGTELKGRLFIGNIKKRSYNSQLLADFSTQITISQNRQPIEIIGMKSDPKHQDIYTKINYDARISGAWSGGYYNPRNVHDYLGYWGNEAYNFGIAYIFEDGTYSPVFPVRGIDLGIIDDNTPLSNFYTNVGLNSENRFLAGTGENIKGIFRFSKRTNIDAGMTSSLDGGLGTIIHPMFNIPDLPTAIADEGVIGFRLFRARRKIDCIAQGMLMNTAMFPVNDEFNDRYIGNNRDIPFSETNMRYVPAFNYMLETISRNGHFIKTDRRNSSRIPAVANQGIEPVFMSYAHFRNPDVLKNFYFDKKFALISPDFICNPVVNQRFYNSEFYTIQRIGTLLTEYAIPTSVPFDISERTPKNGTLPYPLEEVPYNRYFSLIKQIRFTPELPNTPLVSVKADYVTGHLPTRSTNGFSSKVNAHASFYGYWGSNIVFGTDDGARDYEDFGWINTSFNDYVGISSDTAMRTGAINRLNGQQVGNPTVFRLDRNLRLEFNSEQDGVRLNTFNFTYAKNTREQVSKLVNLYVNTPRTTNELNDLYFPEYESFFPITQPMYFKTEYAREIGADTVNGSYPSLEDMKDVLGNIPAFNGDCFLGYTHRRMFFNGLSRTEPNVPAGFAGTNTGYSVAFLSESNYNVAGRYEEIADINEGVTRSFAPYHARNFVNTSSTLDTPSDVEIEDAGSVKGEDNEWRIDRLPESTSYNTGYDRLEVGRFYLTLGNVPFIQENFTTRIMYSSVYNSASFINGYRYFSPLSFEDYPQHLGQIVSLKALGTVLIAVCEYGVIQIPINERLAGVGDSAGSVFFRDSSVLTPSANANYISEKYGSQWQGSIVASDNTIYGVDIHSSKIWRISSNLELISDFKVQSFLRQIQPQFRNQIHSYRKKEINSYYDQLKADVIFTFISYAGGGICGTENVIIPPTCPDARYDGSIIVSGGSIKRTITYDKVCYDGGLKALVYNELPLGKWVRFNNWYPKTMFTIQDRLFSFDIVANTHQLHEHYIGNFSYYYNQQRDSVIEINATLNTWFRYLYDNLKVLSTHIYPYKIEYTTEDGFFTQTVRPELVVAPFNDSFKAAPLESVNRYDARYQDGVLRMVITHDEHDTRKITPFNNNKIRDRFCKIRLYYNTSQKLIIQAINTKLTQDFS